MGGPGQRGGGTAVPAGRGGERRPGAFAKTPSASFFFSVSALSASVFFCFPLLTNSKMVETFRNILIYHFAPLVKIGAQLEYFGRTNLI